MSNYDYTDPGQHHTNPDIVLPGDPGFNVRESMAYQQQLEGLGVLLDRLQTSFKDMAGLLSTNLEHITKSAEGVERMAGSQDKSNRSLREQLILQQRVAERTRLRDEAEQKINKEIDKGSRAIREQMRNQEMYDRKRGGYMIPGDINRKPRYVPVTELEKVLQDKNSPEREAILQSLRGTAVQNAGKPDSHNFRFGELAKALSRGDFGGAFGELMQRGYLGEKFIGGLEQAGLKLSDFGANNPGLPAALARGGGRFLTSGMFMAAMSKLATPAAALATLEVFRRSMRSINQTRDIGMITGEGFGAGVSARGWSFVQGLNPFDMISGRDALEAQLAMRQAGYRGSLANAGADLVTDMRQKLGLPIADSAQLVVTALRNTNMTVKEARIQLGSLRDSAHDAGLSVKEMADAAQQAMATLAPLNRQAAQQAIPNIEGLTRQYQGLVPKQTLGTLSTLITPQTAQTLALRMGIPAWEALSPQFFNKLPILINQYLRSLADTKPAGMTYITYANYLFMAVPQIAEMFAGEGPQGLADLMKAAKGKTDRDLARGLAATEAHQGSISARNAYSDIMRKLPSHSAASTQRFFAERAGHAALSELEQASRQAGLTQEQIQRVVGPLQTALKENRGIKEAVEFGGRELGTISRHGNIKVTLDLAPGFDKYVRATSQWNDVAAGRRSSQGVPRFP